MEERFDTMHCPNCGKEMHKGITTKSDRTGLDWYPGRSAPTRWNWMKVQNAKEAKDMNVGLRFGSRVTWFETYCPSWYCDSCELLLIDTKIELERVK